MNGFFCETAGVAAKPLAERSRSHAFRCIAAPERMAKEVESADKPGSVRLAA